MFLAIAVLVLLFALWSAARPLHGSTMANTGRNAAGQWFGVILATIAVALVVAMCGHSAAIAFTTWVALLGVVLFVRRFLIQYIGDVAAYVSPHVVDRFFDLRARIKKEVWKAAHAVYAMRTADGAGFLYDEIVVVGHSLGSVVVYDVLNRLLNDDQLAGEGSTDECCEGTAIEDLKTRERTRLLLTFGSPLDKTAFVFAMHDRGAGSERDALAASVQPLITMNNRFPWVNVWSEWDIISGPLNFYDTPKHEPDPNTPRVINFQDPGASTPLAAHVEYWDNPLIYAVILSALGETR